MSNRTSNHTLNQRLAAVMKVLKGKYSVSEVARELGVARTTLKRWIIKYQNNGVAGLKESHTWQHYSASLKRAAVHDYLDHHLSQMECCRKYNLSDHGVLMRWVNQYTNGKTLKKTTGGSTKMKARRKTTYEQRLEIVHFTLANDKDYRAAMEKYGVSYSQVYSWVRKYEQDGRDALKDHRGHQIQEPALAKLSKEERLERRIKELEACNQDLAAENFFLKKLSALENKNKK
ncbi:transposase [Limosilactobacillus kribbianus]|uniref:transposase n=1 Tax=Limosilactobacillus kribbianus TaxID=2982695 RepID=UPI002264AB15|nr:transposase [Limosilactobacillus kribbianus]